MTKKGNSPGSASVPPTMLPPPLAMGVDWSFGYNLLGEPAIKDTKLNKTISLMMKFLLKCTIFGYKLKNILSELLYLDSQFNQ